MNLLSLPRTTVIENGIFPYLQWNDLLNLRSVCKEAHYFVHNWMQLHPELAPEIKISENKSRLTLANFVKMKIPCRKIFLSDSHSSSYYEKNAEAVDHFLKKYGSMITHVRVVKLTLGTTSNSKEMEFWEGLTNLKSLNAEEIYFKGKSSPPNKTVAIPSTFRNLQSLKIGVVQENFDAVHGFQKLQALLTTCETLEYIFLPRIPTTPARRLLSLMRDNAEYISGVTRLLRVMNTVAQRNNNSLQAIDLERFRYFPRFPRRQEVSSFHQLCRTCEQYQIKLFNVRVMWFRLAQILVGDLAPDLGSTVVSLLCSNGNDLAFALDMELPSLEILEMRSTLRTTTLLANRCQSNWPMMKELIISVEAPILDSGFLDLKSLLDFFFKGEGYPNLKKITIEHWNGSNAQLVKLCEGLTTLEEISLVYSSSKELNEFKFLMDENEYPVLLNMFELNPKQSTRRIRMRLRDPNIWTGEFLNILKETFLNTNTVKQRNPVKLLTCLGLRSYLGTKFTEFVEKFPVEEWFTVEQNWCWEMRMLVNMIGSSI